MRPIFHGWWNVTAAAVGLAVSPGPIAFYSLGTLMQPLQASYGWDKAQVSFAATLLTLAIIVTTPLIGALVDRIGPKRVLVPSMVGFALGIACVPLVDTLSGFYALYCGIGIVCTGANSLAFMKLLSSWFDRHRGIAVGIASAGMGAGFAVVPAVTRFLVDYGGLAAAYRGLAGLILFVGVPTVVFLVRERPADLGLYPDGVKAPPQTAPIVPISGATTATAVRMRQFWSILAIFVFGAGTIYAVALHLVSIVDTITPGTRGSIQAATLLGITAMFGRVFAGWMFDRHFAAYVSCGIFFAAALGTFVLATGAAGPWPFIGSALLGICSGAEGDALAILVSRYFGLRAYGKIYGHAFCATMIGVATLPYLMGLGYERAGGYSDVLKVFALLLLGTAILAVRLGPYPTYEQAPPDPLDSMAGQSDAAGGRTA